MPFDATPKMQRIKRDQLENHVIDYFVREKAIDYLYQLEDSWFQVVLVPPREEMNVGHKNRACISANPRWYQRFCKENENCRGLGRKKMRRPRTFIKKADCLRVMTQFVAENKRGGVMIERILEFIGRDVANEIYKEPSVYYDDIPF